MFAGLVGSILYSSYVIKNDIKAEWADKKTQATFNSYENEDNIKRNFKTICKRSGIRLDRRGYPISDDRINVAVEYLRYQGYTEENIRVFTRLFKYRCGLHKTSEASVTNLKLKRLEYKLNNNPCDTMVILRKKIYSNDLPAQERIDKLLKNDLWNEIVNHYSCIQSDDGARWEEIWTLKVPKNFFSDISKDETYRCVCKKENISMR